MTLRIANVAFLVRWNIRVATFYSTGSRHVPVRKNDGEVCSPAVFPPSYSKPLAAGIRRQQGCKDRLRTEERGKCLPFLWRCELEEAAPDHLPRTAEGHATIDIFIYSRTKLFALLHRSPGKLIPQFHPRWKWGTQEHSVLALWSTCRDRSTCGGVASSTPSVRQNGKPRLTSR